MSKFRALLVSAVLALAACQPQAPAPPAVPDARQEIDEPATLPLVVDYVQAWNSHDAERVANFLDEEIVYFDASVGDSQRGRAAAIDNVIKVFHRAVPDAVWTLRSEPIATADGVAFEWTISGSNTGDWSPASKATGRALQFDGASFLRIHQGRIVYQADYYDAATVNRQLGWQ